MTNRIQLQLTLAFFWFISIYLIVGALISWEWAWPCGWVNLIIGMIGILLITRTGDGDKIFYRPKGIEPSRWDVNILWVSPPFWLVAAAILGILRLSRMGV